MPRRSAAFYGKVLRLLRAGTLRRSKKPKLLAQINCSLDRFYTVIVFGRSSAMHLQTATRQRAIPLTNCI